MNVARRAGFWMGPHCADAERAYQRARQAGLSPSRALVFGHVVSVGGAWMSTRELADACGTNDHAVTRALRALEDVGLLDGKRVRA